MTRYSPPDLGQRTVRDARCCSDAATDIHTVVCWMCVFCESHTLKMGVPCADDVVRLDIMYDVRVLPANLL